MKDRRPPTSDAGAVAEGGGEADELVDLTEALTVRSKRTERRRKKLDKKAQQKSNFNPRGLYDLPYEIWMAILTVCLPRDIFTLRLVSKPLRQLILDNEEHIAKNVMALRYSTLAQCLQRPVLARDLDTTAHDALQSPLREQMLLFKKKPFHHIQMPDTAVVCTCLTCLARWQSLCVAVDFAHWQKNLDIGEPIPMIPRGQDPKWNQKLTTKHTEVVLKSLSSPLWHARILAAHLDSTVRSVRRHGENKGNKRRRFRMTEEDVRAGTDAFLERSGPPTVSIPAHRDEYYMLEAFLPGRSWIKDHNEWWYLPPAGHDTDIRLLCRWVANQEAILHQPASTPASS
ncbi:hypothetical protein OQA88_8923 [Cercophora sp. LCS_1]